jgi:hypothetical protein
MISDVHESVDLAISVEPPPQDPIHHTTCTWGVVIFVATAFVHCADVCVFHRVGGARADVTQPQRV